jgi:hypothetical protein
MKGNSMTRTLRWGDNDRTFGPFLYSRDGSYRPLALMLSSGDDEYRGCTLRLRAFGHTFIVALPAVIKPWRRWVDCSLYEWAKHDGKPQGYWDVHSREYGFSLSGSGRIGEPLFLQVFFGRQTDDSSTEQRWSKFLPWTEWRHVRHSYYGLLGEHHATEADTGKRWSLDDAAWQKRWDAARAMEDGCPTRTLAFLDFDGERLTACTRIEEREWRFGTGWFKWLSAFRKPKVSRYLEIRFSGETGKRKGSWKGGTVGHSIDMLPGELHIEAFCRYCAAHDMTFLGLAEEKAEG